MDRKTKAQKHREAIKEEFWSEEIAWTGEKPEKGWFRVPRTLPLILNLLRDERLTRTKKDPTGVYLELLARHRDSGVVEMVSEGEHSYAAGYKGTRGVRTWKERMALLEKLGLIKAEASGNQPYKYVLLVHPTIVIQGLQDAGKIDPKWWSAYRQRQLETSELSFAELMPEETDETVVKLDTAKKKRARKKKA